MDRKRLLKRARYDMIYGINSHRKVVNSSAYTYLDLNVILYKPSIGIKVH